MPKLSRPRFFTGAYGKFWNSLLTGAGVASGGVIVLHVVATRTGAFDPPDALALRDAVLVFWGAFCAALGAALGANIEPGSTIVSPPAPPHVTTTTTAPAEPASPPVFKPRVPNDEIDA